LSIFTGRGDTNDIVKEYGADSVRLYAMLMGPLDVTKPWQTSGVVGARRLLNRSWAPSLQRG
jgi:leucyl-tRNA synthetase